MMLVTLNIFMCFNLEAKSIHLKQTVHGYDDAYQACSQLCQKNGYGFSGSMDEYHDEYDVCHCSGAAQPVATPKPAPAQPTAQAKGYKLNLNPPIFGSGKAQQACSQLCKAMSLGFRGDMESDQSHTVYSSCYCSGLEKSVNSHHDEAKNAPGPNRCKTDMDCDGLRTCSSWGWCQGKAR